jgi:actin-like ATPase involved in cell morphogenesis
MATRIAGLDVGTMNMVSAIAKDDKKIDINGIRNMFIEIEPDIISLEELKRTGWSYVLQDEGTDDQKIYVIGEDSFRFAQMLDKFEIRRPMQDGVISSKDIDSIDVLTLMLEKILGKTKDGYCVYSVPEKPIDIEDTPSVLYHEKVFGQILKTLGYKSKPLNEAMGVILSNCKKENYSGIGISFGCGLTNVACSYKSLNIIKFAIARGGDWIDNNVASSLNANVARITSIKEKKLDLSTLVKAKDKREKRVLEALIVYYRDLIDYVLKVFVKEIEKHEENISIDDEIPIIISGGTSMVPGFVDSFKEIFGSINNFPFNISEIRHAEDPLNAVCIGNVISAYWDKDIEEEEGK